MCAVLIGREWPATRCISGPALGQTSAAIVDTNKLGCQFLTLTDPGRKEHAAHHAGQVATKCLRAPGGLRRRESRRAGTERLRIDPATGEADQARGRVVRHAKYMTLQMAEAEAPGELFAVILELIQRFSVSPPSLQRR